MADPLAPDPVGEVDQRSVRSDLPNHRAADAGELVLVAVVGEKADRKTLGHGGSNQAARHFFFRFRFFFTHLPFFSFWPFLHFLAGESWADWSGARRGIGGCPEVRLVGADVPDRQG